MGTQDNRDLHPFQLFAVIEGDSRCLSPLMASASTAREEAVTCAGEVELPWCGSTA